MKKIKKKLRSVLLGLSAIPTLLLLYILFNIVPHHTAKKLNDGEISTYIKGLQGSNSDPYAFVADKFRTHDVVIIGEVHKRKQDLDFLFNLIPYLYRYQHIKIIGWEFGSSVSQKDADSVVTARGFDRQKAISILRRNMYDWCYEEYLGVFRTIWAVNQTITTDTGKIRFLQLNVPYNPRRLSSRDTVISNPQRRVNFDNAYPPLVETLVLSKHQKILIYCGLHHSLTKFYTPKFLFMKDHGRGGQYLYKKYPLKICQIAMLAPFPPRWSILHGNNTVGSEFVYPFDGLFNQVYDRLKKPFAVSSDNGAFSNVEDHDSFYEFDSWSGVKLKDFCDGVIMIASFKEIRPVHIIPDWITTDEEMNEVKSVLPESDATTIKNIAGLNNYIDAKSATEQIRLMHSMKPFW